MEIHEAGTGWPITHHPSPITQYRAARPLSICTGENSSGTEAGANIRRSSAVRPIAGMARGQG
jgi:hypothetical protein